MVKLQFFTSTYRQTRKTRVRTAPGQRIRLQLHGGPQDPAQGGGDLDGGSSTFTAWQRPRVAPRTADPAAAARWPSGSGPGQR